MKKTTYIFLCLLFVSYTALPQVGILSMNNTSLKNVESKNVAVKSLSPISNEQLNLLNFDIPDTTSILNLKYYRRLDSVQLHFNKLLNARAISNDSLNFYKLKLDSIEKIKVNILNFSNRLWNLKYTDSLNYYQNKLKKYASDNSNFEHTLEKNIFLSNSIMQTIDSSNKIDNKTLLNDSLADIFASLRLIEIRNNKGLVKIEFTSREIDRMNKQKDAFDEVYSDIQEKDSVFNMFWKSIASDTSEISKNYIRDTAEFNNLNKKYTALLKSHIIENKKSDNTNNSVSALPQITSIIGKKETIPQLQILGTYIYTSRNTSVEANLGLSVAATGNPDTANLYNIFIPTASTYLFYSNFSYGFWTPDGKDSLQKRLALKLEFSFAGKNIVFDTSKPAKVFNSSVLYARGGMEFAIFPKRFSIYANVNTVSLMNHVDNFKTATSIDSKFFGYIDCGAKFYYDAAPSLNLGQGLYIYSNLNFIINGGDVKRITKTNDSVIPSIQVGIIKSLGNL